jgi:hypothetical protein
MREPRRGRKRSTFGWIAFLAMTLSSGCGEPLPPTPVLTIEGVVYDDATSATLPGVNLRLHLNCVPGRCDLGAGALTDATGLYHLLDQNRARCEGYFNFIVAELPGFSSAQAVIECTAGVQRIDLRLKP